MIFGGQMTEHLDFVCPRCSTATTARFYGPCDSCHEQLRASMGTAAKEFETVAYEPKMNVTPNAVATKE